FFFAYERDDMNFPRLVRVVQGLTGLPVRTFQGRYGYKDPPFIVGPQSVEWETQRLFAALRPLYLRATEFQRDQAANSVRSARFNAIWQEHAARFPHEAVNWLAVFDARGPIRSTMRPIPVVSQVAIDPQGPTYY